MHSRAIITLVVVIFSFSQAIPASSAYNLDELLGTIAEIDQEVSELQPSTPVGTRLSSYMAKRLYNNGIDGIPGHHLENIDGELVWVADDAEDDFDYPSGSIDSDKNFDDDAFWDDYYEQETSAEEEAEADVDGEPVTPVEPVEETDEADTEEESEGDNDIAAEGDAAVAPGEETGDAGGEGDVEEEVEEEVEEDQENEEGEEEIQGVQEIVITLKDGSLRTLTEEEINRLYYWIQRLPNDLYAELLEKIYAGEEVPRIPQPGLYHYGGVLMDYRYDARGMRVTEADAAAYGLLRHQNGHPLIYDYDEEYQEAMDGIEEALQIPLGISDEELDEMLDNRRDAMSDQAAQVYDNLLLVAEMQVAFLEESFFARIDFFSPGGDESTRSWDEEYGEESFEDRFGDYLDEQRQLIPELAVVAEEFGFSTQFIEAPLLDVNPETYRRHLSITEGDLGEPLIENETITYALVYDNFGNLPASYQEAGILNLGQIAEETMAAFNAYLGDFRVALQRANLEFEALEEIPENEEYEDDE